MRTKSKFWPALAAGITILLTGCGGGDPMGPNQSSYDDTDAGGTGETNYGDDAGTPTPDPACRGIIGGESCLPQPVADTGDTDAGENASDDTGSASADTGTPATCPPEDLPNGTRMDCGGICILNWDLTNCTATCGGPPDGLSYPRLFWGAPESDVRGGCHRVY